MHSRITGCTVDENARRHCSHRRSLLLFSGELPHALGNRFSSPYIIVFAVHTRSLAQQAHTVQENSANVQSNFTAQTVPCNGQRRLGKAQDKEPFRTNRGLQCSPYLCGETQQRRRVKIHRQRSDNYLIPRSMRATSGGRGRRGYIHNTRTDSLSARSFRHGVHRKTIPSTWLSETL